MTRRRLPGLQGRRGVGVPRLIRRPRPPVVPAEAPRVQCLVGKRCNDLKRHRQASIAFEWPDARREATVLTRIDRILFAGRRPFRRTTRANTPRGKPRRGRGSQAADRAEILRVPTIDVVGAVGGARHARGAGARVAGTSCRRLFGTPAAGEAADGETFDGETEVATFPALPRTEDLFNGGFRGLSSTGADRPISLPALPSAAAGAAAGDEPCCLTSASTARLQFLIGDRLDERETLHRRRRCSAR